LRPDPIPFARRTGRRGPCAGFVAEWLEAQGVEGTPCLRAIMLDWRRLGVEAGVSHWCARLGLTPCAPEPFAVALAAQERGGALLGVLTADCWFVTRSFSRVVIESRPTILKAWHV